jgi:hypothetical protein
MHEIVPGVWHWTVFYDRIGADVSSYWLAEESTLIDPMEPEAGLAWFAEHGPPQQVLLTNRHHVRHSMRFAERFGCPVRASRPGMHEFKAGERVEPFDFGDELLGGIRAHEVGAICPDETALEVPSVGALAVADGLIRYGGEIGFVSDRLLGDEPEEVKRGLRDAYRALLDVDFDVLLVAHGEPQASGAKDALRRFVKAAPL